ncbi:MAG: hypothetical protein ACRDZ1_10515 [Acidimicrobiia bacterium]
MGLLQNGHAPPGNPFGPGGLFSLSEPERNRELLAGAGFSDVQIEEITGLMRFDGLSDYWALQTAVSGPVPALIASLTADEVDSIRASLEPMIAPFQSGNTYDIPSLAVAVTAM